MRSAALVQGRGPDGQGGQVPAHDLKNDTLTVLNKVSCLTGIKANA